jgi:hypothetical protein
MSKKKEYFFDFSKSFRKSIILFEQIGSVMSPIAYIQKPKHRSDVEFEQFIKSLQIYVKQETETDKGGEQ